MSSGDRLLHAHAAHAPDRSGTGCGAYRSRLPGLTNYDGAAPGACQDEDPRWWDSVRGSARARTAAAARRGARSELPRPWYWPGRDSVVSVQACLSGPGVEGTRL